MQFEHDRGRRRARCRTTVAAASTNVKPTEKMSAASLNQRSERLPARVLRPATPATRRRRPRTAAIARFPAAAGARRAPSTTRPRAAHRKPPASGRTMRPRPPLTGRTAIASSARPASARADPAEQPGRLTICASTADRPMHQHERPSDTFRRSARGARRSTPRIRAATAIQCRISQAETRSSRAISAPTRECAPSRSPPSASGRRARV